MWAVREKQIAVMQFEVIGMGLIAVVGIVLFA